MAMSGGCGGYVDEHRARKVRRVRKKSSATVNRLCAQKNIAVHIYTLIY